MATQISGFRLPILQPISITSGPVVSVSQFGAVGDGKTNDTAALQSALNYVKAHGGTLNFEAGRTYMVSRELTIANADDFKIDGNGATIKMAAGAPVAWGYGILRIESSDRFAVTELTLDGNRATRSTGVEAPAMNVHIKNSHDFSFSDVKAINAVVDGFYVHAADQANRSTYTKNGLFLNCQADNGFRQGMSIINGENIQVIGGAYTNTHGTKPAAGIDVEANPGTAIPGNNNILIQGVKFTGNDGFGVKLVNYGLPTNITVEGSYFANNDAGGVQLGTASTLIKGNTFENFSQSERGLIDLLAVNTNSNNVITENSFNNIGTGHAVIFAHAYSGTNNQVFGNKFYNISGKFLETYTAGTTGWDNVLTSSPTYPTTSSEPTPTPDSGTGSTSPDPAPAPDSGNTDSTSPVPTTSGSVINGTGGADQLVATAKAETINGYDGTDSVSYLNSSTGVTVKLWGGTGVGGHSEGDTLVSIENALGSNYKDRLEGTDAQNWLYGNGGDDILYGRGGIDVLSGGAGLDTLYGGGGQDWMYGNEGADRLVGEDGDDKLFGNADADVLLGQLGNDILYGGDGNDLFYGGQGNDRLIGEGGADRYIFDHNSTGKDIIQGFDVTADKVALAANLNGNGIGTAQQAIAHVNADANGNAVLNLGGGNTVTFQGVKPSQLGMEDFIVT
jgi:Ca2+-binding RTX toxin-like protein